MTEKENKGKGDKEIIKRRKRNKGGKGEIFPLEERFDFILFPALNRISGNRPPLRLTVLECQSTEDKECMGIASKDRGVRYVTRSRCRLRLVSDPDDVDSNPGSRTCRCVILTSLSGPQSPHL